jgi:hypothetical protein
MATAAETRAVKSAGLAQGIAIVAVSAASSTTEA